MSSLFQPKNKLLANIKVVTYKDLDGTCNVLGKVKRGLSSVILSKQKKTDKNYYVDDINVLTKKTKKEIFGQLANNSNLDSVYLVVDKPKTPDKGKVRNVVDNNGKVAKVMMNDAEFNIYKNRYEKAVKPYNGNKKKGR